MPRYTLPDLEYDYGALEPHISAQIMELHHSKHHKAYVEKANDTLDKLAETRDKQDFSKLPGLEKSLAFNISGHVLHSIFWKNLAPKGGDRPHGVLLDLLNRDFGGFEAFQKQMTEAASTVMGSGWSALMWEPVGQRLVICQVYDHQSNIGQGSLPLMVIDAWEHAYYLQYKNAKTEFFNAVWRLWNWEDVASRLQAARQVNLQVPEPAAR